MRCARGNGSTSDAPLFLYLAVTIFSDRFAVRLTIAGNYLPLPSRARRDPTRALLVVALWRHHRLAPDPLFPFLLPRSSPRPLVYDRRRAASSSIGDGLVFLLSITLSTTSRLFTLSMYTCVHTHIHTHARFHAYTIHTCGVVSAGTTLGHPRRTLRGRENIQGRSLRFSSPHGTLVFFSHAASSLARSQREKSLSEPPVLPTPRASTRKRSTTYRFAGSRRLDIVGDNTTTTALAFIAQYFPRKSFIERKRYNLGKSILCIFYVVEAGKRIYINSSLISCFYNDLKIAAVFETKNSD